MTDRIVRLESSVDSMSTRMSVMEDRMLETERSLERTLVDFTRSFEALAAEMRNTLGFHQKILDSASRSLPVPEIMRLFGFFAALVFALIGGLFGIKWVFTDLIH